MSLTAGRHLAELLNYLASHRVIVVVYSAVIVNMVRGISNRSRGNPGNRLLPKAFTDQALDIIKEKYPDFGPTLAREKLVMLVYGFLGKCVRQKFSSRAIGVHVSVSLSRLTDVIITGSNIELVLVRCWSMLMMQPAS